MALDARAGAVAAVAFFTCMSFAAVYLDHHWVVDVLLGWLYCGVSYAAVFFTFERAHLGVLPAPAAVQA